jgi:uncharacterized coiled-coil DUF342 family protein
MAKTDWKSKATENARDKKRLKKKIKELTKSRDDWKTKSIHHKSRADKLAADFKKLKAKLNDLVDCQ